MAFQCLFHVHTRHSMDSVLAPSRIVNEACRLGADVLIITDHNTTRGSRETQRLAAGRGGLLVPTAAEYQTEKGDVIGIFLKEEIRPGPAETVIREIRRQGGLVVLPHPYKAHRLDEQFLAEMDLVEVYNSRCSGDENALAKDLAARLCRPFLGGADAHCSGELHAVMNCFAGDVPRTEDELRNALLCTSRRVKSQTVSGVFRPYSQMIKAVKTGNPILFLSQSKCLAATWLRESWRTS